MSYVITTTDGTTVTTIADYTVDTTTTLSIPGRGTMNYGLIMGNNLVRLLEHAASSTPPTAANLLPGQLWFQTQDPSTQNNVNKVWVYTGLLGTGTDPVSLGWRSVTGLIASATQPSNPSAGDYWYNTTSNQILYWNVGVKAWLALSNPSTTLPTNPTEGTLWVRDGQLWMYDTTAAGNNTSIPAQYKNPGDTSAVPAGWVLVGPTAPATTKSYMKYASYNSTTNTAHDSLSLYVNNNLLGTWSSDTYTYASALDGSTAVPSGTNFVSGLNLFGNLQVLQQIVSMGTVTTQTSNTSGFAVAPLGIASGDTAAFYTNMAAGYAYNLLQFKLGNNNMFVVNNTGSITANGTVTAAGASLTGNLAVTGGQVMATGNGTNCFYANTASGYAGNLFLGAVAGSNKFTVDHSGNVTATGNVTASGSITASGIVTALGGEVLVGGTGTSANISFKSAGSGDQNLYDAAITSSGGALGTNGAGALSIVAASLTIPSPPSGDNSTKAATTAFACGSANFAGKATDGQSRGHAILPSGLIIQWGFDGMGNSTTNSNPTGQDNTFNFDIPFPNQCLSVTLNEASANGWFGNPASPNSPAPTLYGVNFVNNTGFGASVVGFQTSSNGTVTLHTSTNASFYFLAIGH